jgi:hypothetical protein
LRPSDSPRVPLCGKTSALALPDDGFRVWEALAFCFRGIVCGMVVASLFGARLGTK